jgi:ABC-type transport system involved in multi-copper enzyme maturation permease subunit
MIAQANLALWWAQIRAVIRLEMKKTFFAKRGLWVYLLALAPLLIWTGHSINMMMTRDQRREIAAEHPLSTEALESIQQGMTREEVEAKLGDPYSRRTARSRRQSRTWLSYTNGEANYTYMFLDDEVASISKRQSYKCSISQDSVIFATVFQFFYLRLAIFFGCVGIFMNLFRGEMIDKSLHFYLLAPIRREVLLVGKYLAGLTATVVIFTTSTALQLWIISLHFDQGLVAEYLHGPGWGHVGSYLAVTALACLGYGSVFLAAGLLFRNPIIPAATILLWESANLFLPAALKKISVIFYLQSLCPVVAPPNQDLSGPLALLISSAEPTPAAVAVTGLVVLTAVVLVAASMRARKLEINYGAE